MRTQKRVVSGRRETGRHKHPALVVGRITAKEALNRGGFREGGSIFGQGRGNEG